MPNLIHADRYFVEEGTRRGSVVAASTDAQVGSSPWTWRNPSPTQGSPSPSSDPSQLPPQFKKPKTPPPRTIVATTCTEMYMRHTSQDVMVTSPPPGSRRRHAFSSSTSTDSRIPSPPQTSPGSSIQQWLNALDIQAPPPPTSAIPASQPLSMYSGVTSSMPLGYSASQMAPQQVRSSCHSQMSRRSRFSTTSATVIQGMMDFSIQMSNNITRLAEGVRVDAVNREEAMRQEAQIAWHESLAREQCHRQQANERGRVQREEALEQDKLHKQEALEQEKMLRQEAALREEKMRADVLAPEELNIAREKAQAEIKARNKQFKRQASNELQQQKLEMEIKMQIAQMELMERRELEFQQEKLREKDITAKEMEVRLLLERQVAEENCKTLRLEYEAKFRRYELKESRRLAPIPERKPSLGLEQRGPACASVHRQYTYSVPTPSLAHSYGLLESLPRVPVTPPTFTESVVTPTPGNFPLPVSPMLGQLSVVSAPHTALTIPLNLRIVPQAMHNVMSNVVGSSVVAPGAAVSTAACTAPSY